MRNLAHVPAAALAGSLAMTVALALPMLVAPAGALPVPADHVHAFALDGSIHVQARYFDGLGSTKFGFLQFQGDGGRQDDRLDPGGLCTEWHGTFTQVEVKARPQDNTADSAFDLRDPALSLPPDAPLAGGARGFLFDALGSAGAFEGVLGVCDHPGSLGLVTFTGKPAPLLLARQGGTPGIVVFQESV